MINNVLYKQPKFWVLGILFLALCAFPQVTSGYQTSLLAKFLVFGIFALSLDLIWGYSGIVNFGHAIFFGAGAYAMGIALKYLPFAGATYFAVIFAILVPMLIGILLGYFLFYGRVGGVFFGVVTLALTGVVQSIIIISSDLTGGMNGLFDFAPPKLGIPGLIEFDLYSPTVAYYTVLAAAIGCYLLARYIVNSDFGRVIQAIREDEDRVEYLGYNVPFLKVVIFAIACGMAGFSGALYVPLGFISPDLLSIERSAVVLVWVAVGGRGTLIGAFVGTLAVSYMQTFLSDQFVVLWLLFIGVLAILVILIWPTGIVGFAKRYSLRSIFPFKQS
ncbi:branched-chain amino acid ABC transporter permease [Sneathiella litorea]|uniref:Branched-chain amino acid ABC transporter permease n=1 Tax=Sneathiella litorea TaxID=2606216 RepID=A0A6L8W5R6_9PROT|nr:hypothetical protein [Sneathiella litorea]MZR30069.1 hypothetical protein [Sneathiella litorea]